MSVLNGAVTSNGGTIITVPAGGSWLGKVSISASLVSGAGESAKSDQPYVALHGTDADIADNTVLLRVALATPATGLLSLVGSTISNSGDVQVYVDNNSNGSAVTLKLHHNSTSVSAVAIGSL